MKTGQTLILGLASSCLLISSANAQGLIGERFVRVSAIYQDFDIDGASLDAWGGALDVNVPLARVDAQYGFDFRGGLSYGHASENQIDLDTFGIAGGIRGYFPATEAITPFAEVGLGWAHAEVSGFGMSESDSAFNLPLGVGVEFMGGPFSLTPFFTYSVALEDDYDDSWAVGATAAYWFTPDVGGSLSVARTEFEEDVDALGITVGLIIGF